MTPEQQAKIHEYAGTWRAGEKCDRNESIELDGKLWCLNAHTWLPENHYIPMPALTGDYADVVAMKCLRKLAHRPNLEQLASKKWAIINTDATWRPIVADDPAQAIFAAVLAQEGKGK